MIKCMDCVHFKPTNFCVAPENGFSVITGEPRSVFATTNRATDKKCGRDAARWFVAKEIKQSLWDRCLNIKNIIPKCSVCNTSGIVGLVCNRKDCPTKVTAL